MGTSLRGQPRTGSPTKCRRATGTPMTRFRRMRIAPALGDTSGSSVGNICATIFASKRWPINGREPSFETACDLLGRLSEAERLVAIRLLSRFSVIRQVDYPAVIRAMIREHSEALKSRMSGRDVVVVPLLRRIDEFKMKGSVAAAAAMKYDSDALLRSVTAARDIHYLSRPSDVPGWRTSGSRPADPGEIYLFVEDFVGTGKTVTTAMEDFTKLVGPKADYMIFALAGMVKGVSALSMEHGQSFLCYHRFRRGVSDYEGSESAASTLALVDGIEVRVGVSRDYRRGYGQSEALVKMANTPNNTFPMFWWSKTDGEPPWPAMFPRVR